MKNYLNPVMILLIITFSMGLEAQFNYKCGYIIALNNDTISGFINDGGGIQNSKVCLFKYEKKSKAVKYYPTDIKAYRFIDGKYYYAKELIFKCESRNVFTEVLLKGQISLYYDRKYRDMAYFIEKKGDVLIGLSNKKVSVPSQSDYSSIPTSRNLGSFFLNVYKDSLNLIFKDSKKIQNQIGNVDYKKKPLINITKAFINETCQESNCIEYEKDLTVKRNTFGIFTGIQLSNITFWESVIRDSTPYTLSESGVTSEIFMNLPFGVFYNIPLQPINDRLSLQVEMLIRGLNYKAGSISLSNRDRDIVVKSRSLGIPLLLKYDIPRSKITPSVAIGKEISILMYSQERKLNKNQKGGWLCEAGLNYKIGPKLSLFTNLRFQSNYTLIINDRNIDNISFNTAVKNKLYDHRFKTNYAALFFGIKF